MAQVCFYSEPTAIQSEDSLSISLDVSGLLIDDLSDTQGICGVRLFFSHDQIENIRMTLTSPSGQSITLVGPGTVAAGISSFIDWNVLFTPCTTLASPDMGFSDQWSNNQPWASFNLYDGIYFPNNGCLEDFNIGSANGVWTLDIENLGAAEGQLDYFEIIFCDPTGSTCEPCFLDAGDLRQEFFTTCQQDIRLRDLEEFLSADYIINQNIQRYDYVLIEDDNILAISNDITLSDTLPPATYTICGIAYDLSDSIQIASQDQYTILEDIVADGEVCADITDPCFTLAISPVDNILRVDTTLCLGDTLSYLGIRIFSDLDTNILRTNQVTCDSLISITSTVVVPQAIINPSQTITLCGDSIFLNGTRSETNVGNLSYNWMTDDGRYVNDIGPIAEVDTAGFYVLEVEALGCTDTIGVLITSVDTFGIDITVVPAVCVGDTFDIIFDKTVDALIIDGPSFVDVRDDGFTTIESGTYIMQSRIGQCSRSDTIVLEDQAALITIQVSSTIIDCDSTISRTIVTTNALNPIFNYDGPEMITSNSDSIDIIVPGIFTVTVTDINGCTAESAFIIEGSADVPSIITQDLSRNCNDNIMPLPLELLSTIDSVRWTGPNGYTSADINPIPEDSGPYTVTAYAPSGCTTTRTIIYNIINIAPDYSILGDTLTCIKDTVELCVMGNNLDTEWFFDNDSIADSPCIITGMPGAYMVNVLDMNGCTGSGTYDLIEIGALDITITNLPDAMEIACNDSTVTLQPMIDTDNLNLSYAWYIDNTSVSDDINFTTSTNGVYTFEVTDDLTGCLVSSDITITQQVSNIDLNDIIISSEDILCEGDSAAIMISGIDLEDIELYINQELIADPLDIMLAEGEYEFLFVDSLLCNEVIPWIVPVVDPFTLDIGDDITAAVGELIDLEVAISIPISEIESLMWSDTSIINCTFCLDPIITVTQDQVLVLTATDDNGCIQSDSIIISVLEDSEITNVYTPNIFAPGIDGENSKWSLYHPDGIIGVLELRIYDRWGNLVTYRSNSLEFEDFEWDGTYNGRDAEQGVYVFIAKYIDNTNRESLIRGQITLIR